MQKQKQRSKRKSKRRRKRRKAQPADDDDIPSVNLTRPCSICLLTVASLLLVLYSGSKRVEWPSVKHRSSLYLEQRVTIPFQYKESSAGPKSHNSTISCREPYQFQLEENTDFRGNDLAGGGGVKSFSLGHCCAFCIHTVDCKSFTFDASTKFCWMKHSKPHKEKVAKVTGAKMVSGSLSDSSFSRKENRLNRQLAKIGISPHALESITEVYQGSPRKNTAWVAGYSVKYGVYRDSHIQLVQDHLSRERRNYIIMQHAIEAQRDSPKERNVDMRSNFRKEKSSKRKALVVDVGANQGLFALFGAKMGADVIAVEPQLRLCRLINWSVLQNGFSIGREVVLYQSAVLDTYDRVHMRDANINEGAIGTIVPGRKGNIQAHPISDIVPTNRSVAFLKIDVEGAELAALRSAYKLFLVKSVDNVVVEFGPPSRWRRTLNMAPTVGIKVMTEMVNKFSFEIRLLDSQVYSTYDHTKSISSASNGNYKPISTIKDMEALVAAMAKCDCEAYLWFVHNDALEAKVRDTSINGDGISGIFSWLRL